MGVRGQERNPDSYFVRINVFLQRNSVRENPEFRESGLARSRRTRPRRQNRDRLNTVSLIYVLSLLANCPEALLEEVRCAETFSRTSETVASHPVRQTGRADEIHLERKRQERSLPEF